MPDLAPIPVLAPRVAHSRRESTENDRLLDQHKVPGMIAREVEQLQQALEPYGLDLLLVASRGRETTHSRDHSREQPRASFDARDVRYDNFRESDARDRFRERSPFRGDVRGGGGGERDRMPEIRRERERERERSMERMTLPVRRDEVVSET